MASKLAEADEMQRYAWRDELTDVQASLIDALSSIHSAAEIGFTSAGDYVTSITNELGDVEDAICRLLGECVAKRNKIISKRSANNAN